MRRSIRSKTALPKLSLWAGIQTLVILVAVLGILLFDRRFVKLRLGPFFVLEILFAFWLGSAWLHGGVASFLRATRSFPWIYGFGLWSALLALGDLFGLVNQDASSSVWFRYAQHCMLFAYPLIWMTAGLWMYQNQRKLIELVAYATFAVSALCGFLASLGLPFWPKTSVGTLTFLYLMPILYFSLSSKEGRTKKTLLLLALLMWVTFGPYWIHWVEGQVRRTAVLISAGMIVGVPFLLPKRRWGLAAGAGALALGVYFAGVLTPMLIQARGIRGAGLAVLESVQHGEDRPMDGQSTGFQARARAFMWKRAILDWRASPLVGIGFVPEVPSEWGESGRVNNGCHTDLDGDVCDTPGPPVSGPHNSYLSILARTGVVGAALFLFAVIAWGKSIPSVMRSKDTLLFRLVSVFVPINGAIFGLFNVGFESPHNSMILWLFAGIAIACARETADSEHA